MLSTHEGPSNARVVLGGSAMLNSAMLKTFLWELTGHEFPPKRAPPPLNGAHAIDMR